MAEKKLLVKTIEPTELRNFEEDLEHRQKQQFETGDLDGLNLKPITVYDKVGDKLVPREVSPELFIKQTSPSLLGNAGIQSIQQQVAASRNTEGSIFYQNPEEIEIRNRALKNKSSRPRKKKPGFWETRTWFLKSNVQHHGPTFKERKQRVIEFVHVLLYAFRPRKPKFNLKVFAKLFHAPVERIDYYKGEKLIKRD